MATSVLLWLAFIAGAAFPPAFGCILALFISRSHIDFLLLLAGVSWGIQLLGWSWSAAHHSEKYYDLLGSVTFISLVLLSLAHLVLGPVLYPSLIVDFLPGLLSSTKSDASLSSVWANVSSLNVRQCVNSLLVMTWAARLGSHLFARINKDKKDARSVSP
jgi:hypothetical protein